MCNQHYFSDIFNWPLAQEGQELEGPGKEEEGCGHK